MRTGLLLFLAVLAASPLLAEDSHVGNSPTRYHSPENTEIALILDWNSRYVTEGRDNLAGQGLWSTTVEIEKDGFYFGGWLAASDGADYEELNLTAQYDFDLFGIGWYVSYTHLQFLSDRVDDNELGAGFEGPELLFGITPGLAWYYSIDANGSFAQFSLARETELAESLAIEPALLFGRNDGYIAEGHNGSNYITLQFGAAWEVSDRVTLSAYIAQNFAIDSAPLAFADDESLKDFFYGGVAVSIADW